MLKLKKISMKKSMSSRNWLRDLIVKVKKEEITIMARDQGSTLSTQLKKKWNQRETIDIPHIRKKWNQRSTTDILKTETDTTSQDSSIILTV